MARKPRVLKLRRGSERTLCRALVASLGVFVISAAAPASASTCSAYTYYYDAQHLNGGYRSGIAGMLAVPASGNWSFHGRSSSEGHLLTHIVGVFSPTDCSIGLCEIQAGPGVGTIAATGTSTVGSWHPYYESYTDGSFDDASFRSDLTASPAQLYLTGYDGNHYNDGGTTYYEWSTTYGIYGANLQVLVTSSQGSDLAPALGSEIENEPFTSGTCLSITDEESGTHGYGTYVDSASKLQFYLVFPSSWAAWEGTIAGSPYTDLPVQKDNPPFNTYGYFVSRSAWNGSAA